MATGFNKRKQVDVGCNHPSKGNSGIGAPTVISEIEAEKSGFEFLEDLESINESTGLVTQVNVSKDGKSLGMFTICMKRTDPKTMKRWLQDVPWETATGSGRRIQIDLPCKRIK